jgi:hypothetical protein
MPSFSSQFLVYDDLNEFPQETQFWHDNELAQFGHPEDHDQTLNALIFKVRREPRNLLFHLRRIHFCYEQALSAQLYAALLDLIIVLQGKGNALSFRMIRGSYRQLDQKQLLALKAALKGHYEPFGNGYSLFTTGRIGQNELVEEVQQVKMEHDFLALANDFIEYSQLEQAMDVLETGLKVTPERQDLQLALLELYRSTKSYERFQALYKVFSESNVLLADEWRVVAHFFAGQS